MEAQAITLLKSSTDSQGQTATSLIADFHEKVATSVRDQWWSFFWAMVSKYRDQMMYVFTIIKSCDHLVVSQTHMLPHILLQ